MTNFQVRFFDLWCFNQRSYLILMSYICLYCFLPCSGATCVQNLSARGRFFFLLFDGAMCEVLYRSRWNLHFSLRLMWFHRIGCGQRNTFIYSPVHLATTDIGKIFFGSKGVFIILEDFEFRLFSFCGIFTSASETLSLDSIFCFSYGKKLTWLATWFKRVIWPSVTCSRTYVPRKFCRRLSSSIFG